MSLDVVINQMEQYNNILARYVDDLRRNSDESKLEDFSKLRGFSVETIKKAGIFYIGNETEMLIPKYLDSVEDLGVISPANKRPIFHNRYIIPINNIHGNVINLSGYSKEADERYIYGTSRYYRRTDTLYGLENLPLAYDLGYAILTEGITDAIRLRDLGYPNTFAMCGTNESSFIMNQLNRCRFGVIKVHDRDKAGWMALRRWKCNRSITLNTFITYKDIDEMCKDEQNIPVVKYYLNECIKWILLAEHRGFKCASEEVTMYVDVQ